jgi:hypothetical protein
MKSRSEACSGAFRPITVTWAGQGAPRRRAPSLLRLRRSFMVQLDQGVSLLLSRSHTHHPVALNNGSSIWCLQWSGPPAVTIVNGNEPFSTRKPHVQRFARSGDLHESRSHHFTSVHGASTAPLEPVKSRHQGAYTRPSHDARSSRPDHSPDILLLKTASHRPSGHRAVICSPIPCTCMSTSLCVLPFRYQYHPGWVGFTVVHVIVSPSRSAQHRSNHTSNGQPPRLVRKASHSPSSKNGPHYLEGIVVVVVVVDVELGGPLDRSVSCALFRMPDCPFDRLAL